MKVSANSGGIACWLAELNAALCVDTRAKKWKYKFKNNISFPRVGSNPQAAVFQTLTTGPLKNIIFLLWKRDKPRCKVPPPNTQCLKNMVESDNGSVLTLGSQIPSAYPDKCGIQREAKKIFLLSLQSFRTLIDMLLNTFFLLYFLELACLLANSRILYFFNFHELILVKPKRKILLTFHSNNKLQNYNTIKTQTAVQLTLGP